MNLKEPYTFFSLIVLLNIAAYLANIGISYFWNKAFKYQTTINKKEVLSSLLTLFINIAIAIPGYILWTKGIITFSSLNMWFTFILLFVVMDLLMYLLHWASHNIPLLKKIHLKHHEHTDSFNCVSLYYMSPWESVLFGVLLTVIAMVLPVSIYGFIVFLIFNWLYGVITHLNNSANNPYFLIFTTNNFHKNHHHLFFKNYGFYTFFWDKLFKTEKSD